MLRIYICEDNHEIRNFISETVSNHILMQGYDMRVVLATDKPSEVLVDMVTHSDQCLYFLDVDLGEGERNGFALAKEIRTIDARGFIVFVTTHGELAFETFKHRVEAMDYIVKDDVGIMQSRITACIDSVQMRISHTQSREPKFFTTKIFDEIVNVDLDTVVYFETSVKKHRIILTALDDSFEFFGSLSDIAASLPENFIRVHRSYLINKHMIKSIYYSENRIVFKDGSECSISRSAKKILKEAI
ncbi:response regulator transcription factor [Erysipelothrix sp. HDW6C]|uniref:LytR/AlgR family response regulator transcription factor n=1 Tax=Erysipelothrix sp. HDW6C TaxID=2714930 RepID=UPI00140ACA2C|nr:LytTR family DNA-binding domain-containing protein [Erysipelothrix sp. HDW6C]QIK70513.1 response regulator transcription factor [Erysipelothrix sp. HDW6C]